MIKPKLALIPSSYKGGSPKGTLYSILPSDGAGDFDFERAGQATRINKDGLIETVDSNVPRLNYPLIDGIVSGCPSLLLENSATNLIQYSEDFSNSIWTNTGAATSVNPTADLSPDGNLTGNEFNEGTSSSRRGVFEDISVSANQSHTLSVFVKKGTSNLFRIVIAENGDALNWVALQVDLSDNSLTTGNGSNNSFTDISSSISDSDYNGYYRLTLTAKHTTVTSLKLLFNMTSSAIVSSNSYGRSDYIGTNKTVYIWGAQLEQGSYATSYIPTQGSIGTRVAESCSDAGNDQVFNDSEGVLMAEINFENNDTDKGISISDGTSSNRVLFYLATNGNLYGYVFNGNSSIPIVTIIDTNFQINSTAKLAIKYKQNDFSFWVNGIEIGTETIGNTFSSGVLDQLSFTSYGPSANPFYGNVKQLQYFDTALTDEELALLTKI